MVGKTGISAMERRKVCREKCKITTTRITTTTTTTSITTTTTTTTTKSYQL